MSPLTKAKHSSAEAAVSLRAEPVGRRSRRLHSTCHSAGVSGGGRATGAALGTRDQPTVLCPTKSCGQNSLTSSLKKQIRVPFICFLN